MWWWWCRSLLPLLLASLFWSNVKSCDNFLIQHCTDISIGFNPITNIKCVQLIPAQFDPSIDYLVKNYIVQNTGKCNNIVLYNSTSPALFSNQCTELCPEQYCLLFDNQPNTSIINIFYSQSSTYQLINSLTSAFSSYDYFLFDSCSSTNPQEYIYLIVVYVLVGFISFLIVALILRYVISRHLKHGKGDYSPYDWRWLIDCFLCKIRPKFKATHEQEDDSNEVDIDDHNNQFRTNENRLHSFDNPGTSSQPWTTSNSNSSNTRNRQINGGYTSGTSSGRPAHNFSSQTNTPILPHQARSDYIHVEYPEDDSTLNTAGNHRQPVAFPLLSKLSSKASVTMSLLSVSNGYSVLEAKLSPDIIVTRF